MTSGLVSVIIPTYNRAHLVGRAIKSVLAQDYANVEILVVDDGSSDNTRAVMERDFGSNPRVRYLPKANGGVSSARNLGIREARGEFVGLLDSDDAWLPNKLSLQLACLGQFPEAGMVWTDMAAVDDEGKVTQERYLRKMYSTYKYYPTARELFAKGLRESLVANIPAFCGDIFSPMVLGNVVHTSTVLMRRERLDQVGFFNEGFRTGEDYPFHLKTCSLGPVSYVDAVTIHYTVGMADALSSPEKLIQISMNFLATLQTTLEREKDRIEIRPAQIRERLADAYAWVGEEHVNAGLEKEARGYFLKSLSTRPRLKMVRSVLETWLPRSARSRLSAIKRRLKG